LKYEVINNLADADEANVVYLYPSSNTSTNNIYDEYMLVNNSLEKIGQFGADLSNYVTNADF
jgi:4-diphosphocytidyl-2C-methyl-D-erythritol kinase